MAVTLKAASFFYDDQSDSYRVKFTDTQLIANDTLKRTIILQIPSKKVQTCSQTQQFKEEDIDTILDEIEESDTVTNKGDTTHDNARPKSKEDKKEFEESETPKAPITPRRYSQKERLSQKLASIPKPRKSSSRSPESQSQHHLHSKSKKERVLNPIHDIDFDRTKLTQGMKQEWLSCCAQNEEDCDGKESTHCVALKRIKFILEHYAYWMRSKSRDKHEDEDSEADDSSDGDSSDEDDDDSDCVVMRKYEWMNDFFGELGGYCYVSLCDDFEHIRDYHMKLNKNKTVSTIEYFDGFLGKCADKECSCLARHCRDRHVDNMNEKKRRQIFFIKEVEQSSKNQKKKIHKKNTVRENKMYFEINLQTKLDTIHITLRHHHLRLINTDKFITKIYANDGKKSAEKPAAEEKKEDIFRKMTKYSFGESITYWDNKHHRYCDSKYADIRSELLNNKIYPLSLDLYNTIKNRAMSFLQTKKGRRLISLREHDWMKKWKILKDSVITVDHIIALLCYVNVTVLRRVFKLHGFVRRKNENQSTKKKKKYESRDALLERHREIWHWSRLLLECVHCYGVPLSAPLSYYHGIDCKLLFNRFNVMFDIPTSLTLNRDIAYNLSRTINYGRGIAIELSHGGLSDLQSLCLDLSLFSDYPSEEEQLVFHSYLSFNDVIINRMHHDEWLKILRFWYKIKEGFFFNHLICSDEITRNDQLCICAMIINMIIADKRHVRFDTRIPQYMQCLFNECVENNTFVWVIQSEYQQMIKKLQGLLYFDYLNHHKSSQFIQYLIKYKKCNVCNANIFNWKVNHKQFDELFSSKNQWIQSPQYTVYMNDAQNNCLKFHFEAQNKAKNNLFRCRIHLDDKPDFVAKINLGMGLFCAAADNFDNYSYGELRYDKLYNVSLHSLFQTKILKQNKQKEFNLKLQIQLFYVYDFDGKLIQINQSQSQQQIMPPPATTTTAKKRLSHHNHHHKSSNNNNLQFYE
eukprot:248854_1